ncbi:unnamed protein product [Bursaphelenchus okinawaensis]|uniref:Uncharacterized protein n=1 Tax=Bursaphelenchus okinawaensis TaxID=465554 RepID=A0A811LNI0_9BILA|nr:unnamed protein product [Bursaphelenchus okinawaensis]CAG9124482.1 unnamed protein product [Bursaphelenchus okinawaensis]
MQGFCRFPSAEKSSGPDQNMKTATIDQYMDSTPMSLYMQYYGAEKPPLEGFCRFPMPNHAPLQYKQPELPSLFDDQELQQNAVLYHCEAHDSDAYGRYPFTSPGKWSEKSVDGGFDELRESEHNDEMDTTLTQENVDVMVHHDSGNSTGSSDLSQSVDMNDNVFKDEDLVDENSNSRKEDNNTMEMKDNGIQVKNNMLKMNGHTIDMNSNMVNNNMEEKKIVFKENGNMIKETRNAAMELSDVETYKSDVEIEHFKVEDVKKYEKRLKYAMQMINALSTHRDMIPLSKFKAYFERESRCCLTQKFFRETFALDTPNIVYALHTILPNIFVFGVRDDKVAVAVVDNAYEIFDKECKRLKHDLIPELGDARTNFVYKKIIKPIKKKALNKEKGLVEY